MKNVTFKELHTVAEDITTKTYSDNGIVNVFFSFKGNRFECQYDSDNFGLYGFSIETPRVFFGLQDEQK